MDVFFRTLLRFAVPFRFLVLLWAGLLLAAVVPASGASPKVAILVAEKVPSFDEALDGIRQHFKSSGTEVAFDIVYLSEDKAGLARVASAIQSGEITAVVSLGSSALSEALKASRTVPIISGMILRSDGNPDFAHVAGVTLEIPLDIQFEWLRRFMPKAKAVGILYNPEENREYVVRAVDAAGNAGFQLKSIAVEKPQDLPAAIKEVFRNVDVVLGINDTLVLSSKTAKYVLLASFQERIPFVGLSSVWVKAGAFYALDRDYGDIGRQCGELLEKHLRGSDIKSLGWSHPRKVQYIINEKTIEHMKISLPVDLRNNAATKF